MPDWTPRRGERPAVVATGAHLVDRVVHRGPPPPLPITAPELAARLAGAGDCHDLWNRLVAQEGLLVAAELWVDALAELIPVLRRMTT